MRNIGDATEVGTILSEERVFEDARFTVVKRVIETPAGIVREPQLLWDRTGRKFSMVVATDEQGRFVLVEEPKYGQMRRMISAPTGGIKKEEAALDAAKRELLDETGYESGSWQPLEGGPTVDFGDKTDGGEHFIFRVTNARKVREPKDPSQVCILATRAKLRELMFQGRLPAISIAALFLVHGTI